MIASPVEEAPTMSQLKVYGTPMSRTARTLWMCRELGLPFELVSVQFADGSTKTPEYLALNPNGRIPTIQDGDFTLYESMAINLYLARKHPGPLTPATLEDEARAWQWSFWVMTEVEKPLLGVLLQRIELPPDSPEAKYFRERVPKDAKKEEESLAELTKPFAVLDAELGKRRWLGGDRFTVTDLNVASVMAWARMAGIDLAATPRVADWLGRCLSRPAFAGPAPAREAAR
jgi:glutathione S-transferase